MIEPIKPVVAGAPKPIVTAPKLPDTPNIPPVTPKQPAQDVTPIIGILYSDKAAVPTMKKYLQYSQMYNADKEHIAKIIAMIADVEKWQKSHVSL